MDYGAPEKIVKTLVWDMDFEDAHSHLHNLPPEIKIRVIDVLRTAAAAISKLEGKAYEKNGSSLSQRCDID